jgi:ubiquinone/menaquinone biosynthesis C-methylase UbiE
MSIKLETFSTKRYSLGAKITMGLRILQGSASVTTPDRAYIGQPVWNERIYYELVSQYTRDRRWLDLGCGRGTDEQVLLSIRRCMGERVHVGVDIEMRSLRDSVERNRVCANVESLPFASGSFDLVTSNMVFEHLDDPIAALKEAHRVLDDRGILVIHTACSRHYMLMAGRLLSSVLPRETYRDLVASYTERKKEDIFPTRYRVNTEKKLSAAASEAGFRECVVRYLETPLDLPLRLRSLEARVRPWLSPSLKSTILAIIYKQPLTVSGASAASVWSAATPLSERSISREPVA